MSDPVTAVACTRDGKIFVAVKKGIRGYAIDKNREVKKIYSRDIPNVICLSANGQSSTVIWTTMAEKFFIDSFDCDNVRERYIALVPLVIKSNEKCVAVASVGYFSVFTYPEFNALWNLLDNGMNLTYRTIDMSLHSSGSQLVVAHTNNLYAVVDPVEKTRWEYETELNGISYIAINPEATKVAIAAKNGALVEIRNLDGDFLNKLRPQCSPEVIAHMHFDLFDRLISSAVSEFVCMFRCSLEQQLDRFTLRVMCMTGLGKGPMKEFLLSDLHLQAICCVVEYDNNDSTQILAAVDKLGCVYIFELANSGAQCRYSKKIDLATVGASGTEELTGKLSSSGSEHSDDIPR